MLGQNHAVFGWAGVLSVEVIATAAGHPISDFTALRLFGHQVPELPLLLAVSTVGSLLPDIDHPNARISKYKVAGVPLLKAASYATSLFVQHRGPTHSLLVWAALSLGALLLAIGPGLPCMALAFSLGYLFHIIADGLTRTGVPFLWPFNKDMYGVPPDRKQRFATGSLMEYLVLILVCLIAIGLVFKFGWPLV